jgi:hypothetical protein
MDMYLYGGFFMDMVLCDLSLLEAPFRYDSVYREIKSKRIINLMRTGKWYIDRYDPKKDLEGNLKVDFGSVAFRVLDCWIEDNRYLCACLEFLDTPSALVIANRFPDNIKFVLKGYNEPIIRRVMKKNIPDEKFFLIGFSYVFS